MNLLRIALAGLLIGSVELQAQEERAVDHFAGVGTRAMGMGGAFVGVADDFTALYWNPAGLAQLGRREVHVALARNRFEGESRLAPYPSSEEALSNTRFGSMGVVWPVPVYRGSLVFAAGVNRIADFDWALRLRGWADSLQTDQRFRHEGGLSATAVGAAVDVSPSLSLGAALSVSAGDDNWVNEFTYTDSADYFLQKRYFARELFSDDYDQRYCATLGALIRSPRGNPKLRFGATLTAGTRQRIHYEYMGPPSGAVLADSSFNEVQYDDGRVLWVPSDRVRNAYELTLPLEFGVGISVRPASGLWLAGSAHLAEWSQTEYRGTDEYGLRGGTALVRQYRDLVRYHLGLEYQVPSIALDLRAGFYTDPLPFVGPRHPDEPVDPVANPLIEARQDRRFITLGAGLLFEEALRVDVAWVRGSYEQVEGRETDKGTIDRAFMGVSYLF